MIGSPGTLLCLTFMHQVPDAVKSNAGEKTKDNKTAYDVYINEGSCININRSEKKNCNIVDDHNIDQTLKPRESL